MINIMYFFFFFFFLNDGFILNMVIISDLYTQHIIWYLQSESNHVMSTNGKVILVIN